MGTRAFVIGNGPSLEHTDLGRITGEISLSVNRIDLYWKEVNPTTKWRPTHWFVTDLPLEWDAWREAAPEHVRAGREIIMMSELRPHMMNLLGTTAYVPTHHYVDFCQYHQMMGATSEVRPLRWHYEEMNNGGAGGLPTFCKFCGSTNVAFQYAVFKGFDPIYLVGCDAKFRARPPGSVDFNHFAKGYEGWQATPSVHQAVARTNDLQYSLRLNKEWADSHGVTLLDATIHEDFGAELAPSSPRQLIVPRVDFESLV